jgi:hypothetical protein
VSSIERKLTEEANGGLLFKNQSLVLSTTRCCHPGSGPEEDRLLVPRHLEADVLQRYSPCHSLMV